MSLVLGFDVYGTLINPHGLVPLLQSMVGEKASALSQTWREKQLEYSFRRGLMRQYEDFSVCTKQALDYAQAFHGVSLESTQVQTLLDAYRTLPAFVDAAPALAALKKQGHRLLAFSNGSFSAVDTVLSAAQLRSAFDGIVSVETVRSFKPNPDVYQHFLDVAEVPAEAAWLVSSNPFDVIGARAMGLSAAWIQRDKSAVFDPWDEQPSVTLDSLMALGEAL